MGGVFSAPKAPAPDPSIAEAQKRQEDALARQEKRASEREASQARQVSSRQRARRFGGLRLLLSPERDSAQAGLSDTLGGSSGA